MRWYVETKLSRRVVSDCAYDPGARAADAMNAAVERYAHLVLALGQHDPDYVDAFYGPADWKTHDAISAERPLVPSYHLGA